MLLCWSLAVVFAVIQATLPLPPTIIAALSTPLHDLYTRSLPDYATQGSQRVISSALASTIQSALLIGACGTAFFLTIRLCKTRERILGLALCIIIIGAAEAIYGLAALRGSLASPASGTFVNRNHFAALLMMTLCLGVGLLFSRWQPTTSEGDAEAGPTDSATRLDRWARHSPLVVLCLTILAGVIFSFSRMGLMAPLLMLLLFGTGWMLGPVTRRVRLLGAILGAVSLLLMGGAWSALGIVAERFQTLEETYRIAAWEGTYRLFESSPFVGVGLGSLVDNLPRFLPDLIRETFDHSHNEPLEILAEGGMLYAGVVGTGLAVYFGTVIPVWWKRRDPFARGIGLGCLAGSTSILLHSLVEFPLRMPANALVLSTIMGLGWVAVFQRAGPQGDEQTSSVPPRSVARRTLPLTVAIAGMGLSAVAGAADLLDRVGDALIARAAEMTGHAHTTLVTQATTLHQWAVRIEPWQPAHSFKLGRIFEQNAVASPPASEQTQTLWASTASAYWHAVKLHPANARFQVALAWASLQNSDLITGRRAVQAALWLTPNDSWVRLMSTRWYLIQWENLTAHEQRLVKALVHRGIRESRELYVEATWELVRDPTTARQILPNDLQARRLLLNRLTEGQFFTHRWAELDAYPALRKRIPATELHIVSYGNLSGRQEPPSEAVAVGSWTGIPTGWLSSGMTASLDLELPRGEVVLYIPRQGKPAGGVWPSLAVTLAGQQLPLQPISAPGWTSVYVLLSSPGGRLRLQASVSNPGLVLEHGRFVERRVALGSVKILFPSAVP